MKICLETVLYSSGGGYFWPAAYREKAVDNNLGLLSGNNTFPFGDFDPGYCVGHTFLLIYGFL